MAAIKGYQALLVSTVAVAPTVPVTGAQRFMMSVEGAASTAIRWRADGTAPTSTVGQYAAPGKDFVYNFEPGRLQLIRDTAATTDATVHFHFLGD